MPGSPPLLTFGNGSALNGYALDGSQRFRRFTAQHVSDVQLAGGYAYARLATSLHVLDPATGETIAQPSRRGARSNYSSVRLQPADSNDLRRHAVTVIRPSFYSYGCGVVSGHAAPPSADGVMAAARSNALVSFL